MTLPYQRAWFCRLIASFRPIFLLFFLYVNQPSFYCISKSHQAEKLYCYIIYS